MSEINPISAIRSVMAVNPQATNRDERQLDLKVSQIVQASVAEAGQDSVLLDMGHLRLRAQARLPLQQGQKLTLVVHSLSPQIELRIVEDSLARRLGQGAHLLGGKWDFLPLMQALAQRHHPQASRLSPSARKGVQAWLSVFKEGEFSLDGPALKALADHMGLDFEKELERGRVRGESLKGVLLETQAQADDAEPAPELQRFELLQLLKLRLSQLGAQLVPLPLPFLEQAYMVAEEGGHARDEGEDRHCRISLHMALTRLGNVTVDLLRDAQGVFIRFSCDSEEQARYLARCESQLREHFKVLPLAGLVFTAGAQPPVQSLMERLLPEGNQFVSARV